MPRTLLKVCLKHKTTTQNHVLSNPVFHFASHYRSPAAKIPHRKINKRPSCVYFICTDKLLPEEMEGGVGFELLRVFCRSFERKWKVEYSTYMHTSSAPPLPDTDTRLRSALINNTTNRCCNSGASPQWRQVLAVWLKSPVRKKKKKD